MKLAIILRGVPGSGKNKHAKLFATLGKTSAVHSPENFFLPGLRYRIDKTNRARLDKKCLDGFTKSIENGVEVVIFNHTNVIRFRYQKYIEVAKLHEYEVVVTTTEHPDADMAVLETLRDISAQEIHSMIHLFQP